MSEDINVKEVSKEEITNELKAVKAKEKKKEEEAKIKKSKFRMHMVLIFLFLTVTIGYVIFRGVCCFQRIFKYFGTRCIYTLYGNS